MLKSFHSKNNKTTPINEIDQINTNEIILLKFDNVISKYDQYIYSLDLKVINITDEEIINFYDIDVLPTILVYKNKNLIDSITGFYTKTLLFKKLNDYITPTNI